MRVLPRRDVPDMAITRIEGATRLTASDSLTIEVEARSFGAVAAYAAARDPADGPIVAVISAAVAVGVGLFVLGRLLARARVSSNPAPRDRHPIAPMPDWSRRRFTVGKP